MILPEEALLADAALVGLDSGVSHLMASHVGTIAELHVTDVALKELAVRARVGGARFGGRSAGSHVVVVRRAGRHVLRQFAAAQCAEGVARAAAQHRSAAVLLVSGIVVCNRRGLLELLNNHLLVMLYVYVGHIS